MFITGVPISYRCIFHVQEPHSLIQEDNEERKKTHQLKNTQNKQMNINWNGMKKRTEAARKKTGATATPLTGEKIERCISWTSGVGRQTDKMLTACQSSNQNSTAQVHTFLLSDAAIQRITK